MQEVHCPLSDATRARLEAVTNVKAEAEATSRGQASPARLQSPASANHRPDTIGAVQGSSLGLETDVSTHGCVEDPFWTLVSV